MRPGSEDYGAIRGGAIGVRDGTIQWVGREADLAGPPDTLAREIKELPGSWVTPGLIDCHTHLVFGGNRSEEFERRVAGQGTYLSQAHDGDGILSTVRATRAATADTLTESGLRRTRQLIREGVTTVEIKSGYGLDRDTELRTLDTASQIGVGLPVDVRKTYLGAHSLPPEFLDDRKGYLDFVTLEMIPELAKTGRAHAVDAFCETVAFSANECRRVLLAARDAGLDAHLHADQLTDGGGAALAAEMGALSADHLEYTTESGVRALAEGGCAAVLLPGAYHFLSAAQRPPIEHFRTHGVPMALATDMNPGSSPVLSLLVALGLGVTLFGLSPVEGLEGVTRHAALALGLQGGRGQIEVGMRADLAIWDVDHPRELAYWMGGNPLRDRVFGGVSDQDTADGGACR